MSQTHLLSDAIARIRNAQLVKKEYTVVYYSKNVEDVLGVLLEAGYISDIKKFEERKGVWKIKVYLKYDEKYDTPVIDEINVISKPGLRVFRSYKKLNKVNGGLGITVLSTSKGVIDDNKARDMKIGGEILCSVF